MKRIILFLPLLLLLACTPKEESSNTLPRPLPMIGTSEPVPGRFATEELADCFVRHGKGGGVISQLFDSIKAEYPRLLADIAFLKSDSMKGITIDCIGVTHYSATAQSGWKPALGVEGKISQEYVRKKVMEGGYDIVSGDFSSYFGRLNRKIAINEQLNDVISLGKVLGSPYVPTVDQAEAFIVSTASIDFVCSLAYNSSKKPYVIGTEPRWVYLTNQYVLSQSSSSPGQYAEIEKLSGFLCKVRSEISYSRMAQYLTREGKGKKAVLLYGADHIRDYRELQKRFGTGGVIM